MWLLAFFALAFPSSGFSVYQAPDIQRVILLQCIWQEDIWQVLIANRTKEAVDCSRANRCCAAVRGSRESTAVYHGVTYLHAGWEAVDQYSASFLFHGLHQTLSNRQVLIFKMKCRSQLTLDGLGEREQFVDVLATDDDGGRAKHFLQELCIGCDAFKGRLIEACVASRSGWPEATA